MPGEHDGKTTLCEACWKTRLNCMHGEFQGKKGQKKGKAHQESLEELVEDEEDWKVDDDERVWREEVIMRCINNIYFTEVEDHKLEIMEKMLVINERRLVLEKKRSQRKKEKMKDDVEEECGGPKYE
ncbi:hypothetical protein F5I97DRAFT_1925548 [Phlebopus sp. FC_14]|nr:hypothetical protein F5I97DRAFT_1925548 [Phlebopus sp. FC_14]